MSSFDSLKRLFAEANADKKALEAKLAPHRKAIDDAQIEIQKYLDLQKHHSNHIKMATPELQRLDQMLSRLALLMGGKRMSDVP